MEKDLKFAVLIDADNAPRTALKEIMTEIARYGTPTIKRIYGDWTSPGLGSWKELLLEHAIVPMQQYAYTTGKNSTDSAMIIDAMDILHSGVCDGFVLVSSDSDFTRLALRLREAGMVVYGIGEKKTPRPFIVACNKFIYVEAIRNTLETKAPVSEKLPAAELSVEKSDVPGDVVETIADLIKTETDEDGWVFLGTLGTLLTKNLPDFDSRNYGFAKLSKMLAALPKRFELRKDGRNSQILYVRDKKRRD